MTSKITKFDRKTCRTVSSEAQKALQAVAEAYGLTLEPQPGRFSATTYTLKFTLAVTAGTTESGTAIPGDFAQKARLINLPEDCFGQTFKTYNGTYTVTGINLRARKYPVLGTDVTTGKKFKFNCETVKNGLSRAKAA